MPVLKSKTPPLGVPGCDPAGGVPTTVVLLRAMPASVIALPDPLPEMLWPAD
jgi:hypothetical protein